MIEVDNSWALRVRKINSFFNIPSIPAYVLVGSVAKQIKTKLNSIFDRFWLDQMNQLKLGPDNLDHNKLRFYKSIKSCFKSEPYLSRSYQQQKPT